MTPDEMQARLEQLEATVGRLKTHARHADGIIALLVGVVAEASGLELDLDIDKEDMPGANHEPRVARVHHRALRDGPGG